MLDGKLHSNDLASEKVTLLLYMGLLQAVLYAFLTVAHWLVLEAKQKKFVNTAKHSANSLLNLISDILDFSKIEANELVIEHVIFHPKTLIEDTTGQHKVSAQAKGLGFAVNSDLADACSVIGDPYRVTQILNNLCSNAIKFTESGSIEVDLRLDQVEGQHRLYVSVVDTGLGIAESSIPRLFDSFTQADVSTTRQYGGTGLGLAISQQLCELMGGEIWAKSVLGEGSTFEFYVAVEMPQDTLIAAKNTN